VTDALLSPAQKQALRALADGEMHETSRSSASSTIAVLTAKSLHRRRWVTRHFVVNGREVSPDDLKKYRAYEWRLVYRITDAGREALKTIVGWER
jgi:hypothetical protein